MMMIMMMMNVIVTVGMILCKVIGVEIEAFDIIMPCSAATHVHVATEPQNSTPRCHERDNSARTARGHWLGDMTT